MIAQVIYLEDYDWLIKVYYVVTTYYTDEILSELESIDCTPIAYLKAEKMLTEGYINTGFAYTDSEKHISFIIIGLTDSAEEFVNSYDHEKGHVAIHISEYYDIDPYSEDFQYLQGKIGEEMFSVAKKLMCEHCRTDLIINFINFGKMKFKTKIGKEG